MNSDGPRTTPTHLRREVCGRGLDSESNSVSFPKHDEYGGDTLRTGAKALDRDSFTDCKVSTRWKVVSITSKRGSTHPVRLQTRSDPELLELLVSSSYCCPQ